MPSNVRLPTPLDKSLCLVSHLSISFDQEAFCDSTPPCLNSGLARTMVAIARRHASSPSLSLPLPLCQPCRSSCPAPPPPLAPPPMLLPLKRLRRLLEESALFRFQLENNRQVGGREHHACRQHTVSRSHASSGVCECVYTLDTQTHALHRPSELRLSQATTSMANTGHHIVIPSSFCCGVALAELASMLASSRAARTGTAVCSLRGVWPLLTPAQSLWGSLATRLDRSQGTRGSLRSTRTTRTGTDSSTSKENL